MVAGHLSHTSTWRLDARRLPIARAREHWPAPWPCTAASHSIARMTHDDGFDTRSRGGRPQQEPLTLKGGGLGGATPMVIAAGVAGLFGVAMVVAIANGKLLWLTIPLAIIFALACLTFLASVRRSAIPYGVVIDAQGIHTTLRGARTASFTWDNIDAAGICYEMISSRDLGAKRPGNYKLDLFCSIPQHDISVGRPAVGYPQRIEGGESPSYGVADGHIRIDFGAAYPSKRQRLKYSMTRFGGERLIEDFERPRTRSN